MSYTKLLAQTSKALRGETRKALQANHLVWQQEMPMFRLNAPEHLNDWVVGCDQDIGGFSRAKLDITPQGTVPKDAKIARSGYAAIRSKKLPRSLFSETYWDTSPFRYLALRVKGDDRKYLVNIRGASFMKTDLYQHRLFLRTPGQWETVHIPFRYFTLTNNGAFVAQDIGMFREKIETVGLSLSDKHQGPFRLEIDWIKAYNTNETDGDNDRLIYEHQPMNLF
ncbi:hypothetical protein H4R34_003697 [Dimargaris verticillata]|uniref:NADH:ubiquinone oxidoreductase intermediate-associated protein 30 domain-containing protein n=1 Tax=Dimargaris verticillata TaxID=2761393 RepID=A0A9W8B6C9_9FUNG|nr:hypothetical protein H4R34_003697 [Dimargaris verticillata]